MLENITEDIETKIEKLKTEHRDLDDVLKRLSEDRNVDELQIRRMKKRKLQLKDTITMLESQTLAGVSAGK